MKKLALFVSIILVIIGILFMITNTQVHPILYFLATLSMLTNSVADYIRK